MKKFCALVMLVAIFSSCSQGASPEIEIPPYDGPTADEIKEKLRLEKVAWKQQGITHYRYTMQYPEQIPYDDTPYTVTVYSGTPRVTAYDGFIFAPESSHFQRIIQDLKTETIDQLFNYIEDAIVYWGDDEYLPFIIKYHKQYHYPEYFGVLHSDNTHWTRLEITEFEKLR